MHHYQLTYFKHKALSSFLDYWISVDCELTTKDSWFNFKESYPSVVNALRIFIDSKRASVNSN